ncbi:MAG: hypothetical protein EOP18_02720, partial [Rhizobiaceae bacterium]
MPTDAETLAAFDVLFETAVAAGPDVSIDYDLPAPRWQFICHVADTRDVVLHGSGNPSIARFEPRQPTDITEFGNRNAIYGASDGLWPMYYAILDRERFPMSLNNTSVRLIEADGSVGEPHYFFSISEKALVVSPWRRGMVYFLPRNSFEQQAPSTFQGQPILIPQWAGAEPVVPL